MAPAAACAALLTTVACGGRTAGTRGPTNTAADAGATRITLYRDRALVQQRVTGTVVAGVEPVFRVPVARDASAEDVYVIDAGGAGPVELRGTGEPGVVEVALPAARPGPVAVQLGYATRLLAWTAQYTMLTSAAHDRSTLRGAIAIDNTAGVALLGSHLRLVDTELGRASQRATEQLKLQYAGTPPSTTPVAPPRALGVADVRLGETRLELLASTAPRAIRSVLVYDPIGVALDHPGRDPELEVDYGVAKPAKARVSESLELARDAAATTGLPGGPVRLFERGDGGELAMLGESRIFDAATRVAQTDIVEVGTAVGVTGARQRRDFMADEDRHRVTEEIRVVLTNARPIPVEVVVREHLYRSESWSVAYSSHAATKDGPQQISMRVRVPARASATATYVVVYAWGGTP